MGPSLGVTGFVQADAATVFDRLYNGQAASAVEVGCWAHARRKFNELQDTDIRVAYPLQLISRIYKVERLADVKKLATNERKVLRQKESRPILEKLRGSLMATLDREPPSSDLAGAAGYTLNQWVALTRFLEDGRLSLDNNLSERQLRTVAVGRKNYMFAGSHEGARRATTIYTVLQSATLHGLAPLAYLTDVLQKLNAGAKATDLMPHRSVPTPA